MPRALTVSGLGSNFRNKLSLNNVIDLSPAVLVIGSKFINKLLFNKEINYNDFIY